jgi:hypothetical protein
MATRFFFILFFMLLVGFLPAQVNKFNYRKVEFRQPSSVMRAGILSPKMQLEYKRTESSTVMVSFRTNFVFATPGQLKTWNTSPFGWNPGISAEPRFYLNLKEKENQGKNINCFSGHYLGIPISWQFQNNSLSIGSLLGTQQKFSEYGFWNAGFGIGAGFSKKKIYTGAIGEISIGFILNHTNDNKPRMSKEELRAPKSR